ncbi:hypothetical protein WME75_32880 [Sorangium sp. So ce1014]|uniref:hypothetical protein n=1 Tax=Sorangium sp. So ce1014 TaxID=3133326 RepID=UPI003F5EB9F7
MSHGTRGGGGGRGAGARPPHPATVVQRKGLPPHPATVVQPKAPHPATVSQQRPPHAAAVAQQRRAAGAPAGRTAPAPAVAQRWWILDAMFGSCTDRFRPAPAYVPLGNVAIGPSLADLRAIADADAMLQRSNTISGDQCSGNAVAAFEVLTGEEGPSMRDGRRDDWGGLERAWERGDGVFRLDISIGEVMPSWGHAFVLLKVGGASMLYQAFLGHYTMREWIAGVFEDDMKRPARLRDRWDAALLFEEIRAVLQLVARDSLDEAKGTFGPLNRKWFANETDHEMSLRWFRDCSQFHTYWSRGVPRIG